MTLVDVVNFNADASCLPSSKWLRCLEGGEDSVLLSVLRAYVTSKRKVNLGLIGATVDDIAHWNPAAIAFINDHQETFEIVVRPYAHDNGLLRLPNGFRTNVEVGLQTLRSHFRRINDYFLAPEVMITGEQIRVLRELGIVGVFLHKSRYDVSVTRHIPDQPFPIFGVFGTEMSCIPFVAKDLELRYLRGLHGTVRAEEWAASIRQAGNGAPTVIWRDGESCLMHPLAPRHESEMLKAEAASGIERLFLSELPLPSATVSMPDGVLRYFPLHSMRPWLDSMKLYWFIGRVQRIEQELDSLPDDVKRFWLLTINSDILSAAEKSAPIVDVSEEVLRADANDFLWEGIVPLAEKRQVILTRSERAGEGEDYLAYCELVASGRRAAGEVIETLRTATDAHLRKAYARLTPSRTRM